MNQIDSEGDVVNAGYEDRIICFIDLLGFKSAIQDSLVDAQILNVLYEALHKLEGKRLVDLLHGSTPVIAGNGEIKSARSDGTIDIAREHWPIVVTQFSDSFVISCSANNNGSCLLLLQAIEFLQMAFFNSLGILMRGGVSKGLLIHAQDGPLFGPAMNAAYELESKMAIDPRVLLDGKVEDHYLTIFGGYPSPIFTTFDGYGAVDLVSFLAYRCRLGQQDWKAFNEQLLKVEQDIEKKSFAALPKVHYLKDRLSQHWQNT